MKQRKTFAALTALCLILSLCAGCAQGADPASPSAQAPAGNGGAASSAGGDGAEASSGGGGAAVGEVVIGAVYPLTGTSAAIGTVSINALEMVEEIVNNNYDLDIPLARGEGLPNLGGAKVKIIIGDSQGLPVNGQSEAERLITQQGAVAVVGAFQSAVAKTVSQSCEKLEVPFVCADSSAISLSEDGYKWFFRTGTRDDSYAKAYIDYIDGMRNRGNDIKTIALVYENTEWGTNAAILQEKESVERGYEVVLKMTYPANTTDVTSEVQKLKAANPDIVLQSSYVSDAILFTKAYKSANFAPKAIFGLPGGFTTPEYLRAAESDANFISCVDVWTMELTESKPLVKTINDMYYERYNVNLDGNAVRTFIAAITALDAINRAGTTENEAVWQALMETNIPADHLIASWGVEFDPDTHENIHAAPVMTQIFDEEYKVIWPFEYAKTEPVFPIPPWDER